ncbi:hypothetical protein [Psychromonas ossibalaenae]|uniref:hypothetical protein n=1 Tax=Psychromonas ossibalaenae TaxID=444922 RepID=UPI00036CFDFF|nr:hypothetical protein [Psychromonas ossibalaenae]
MQNLRLPFILISMLLSFQYAQADSISRVQADDLMAECQEFRKQEIEPLKAIEINKCINEQGKEADHCTRFYKDYGETYIEANGYMQIGMFWGSPICDKALAVEKYFKMYPGSNKYENKK